MDPIQADGNANEKRDVQLEHTESLPDEKAQEVSQMTKAQTRRFKLKVDLHVLPMLGFIYAVSIIDRINIGSAKVLGMQQDLNLGTGPRYSIILMLFFPAYAMSDVPSNWILTRVQPRFWLPFLTFSWGAVLTGMQ